MRNIGSRSFDACLNQLKKSLQDQPTKEGIKLLDLSPNLHHAPCLNEDVNEDSEHHEEQDETSRLAQTHNHRQDRHLNADSKHRHHLRRLDKTEILHRNEQNTAIEIGLRLMLDKLGTTH
jgi:hypothetical protein